MYHDLANLIAKWGEFDGAGAIERAHEAFMEGKISETGVMIHYVSTLINMNSSHSLRLSLKSIEGEWLYKNRSH
jgi:hypothetical protein